MQNPGGGITSTLPVEPARGPSARYDCPSAASVVTAEMSQFTVSVKVVECCRAWRRAGFRKEFPHRRASAGVRSGLWKTQGKCMNPDITSTKPEKKSREVTYLKTAKPR